MDEDVERHLRSTLSRHAQAAPIGGHMLAAVRRESHRRRRTRRLAVFGGALAVVAVVAPLAAVRVFEPSPGATAGVFEPGATIPTPATVAFVPGVAMRDAFPYTPRAPLLGQSTPIFTIVGGEPTLTYRSTRDPSTWATVIARGQPWAAPSAGAKTHSATVRGRQGVSLLDESAPQQPETVLRWAEPLWSLEIRAPRSTTVDELVRYANRLGDQPFTAQAPFTFDLTPARFTVDNLSPSAISFCPPDVVPSADFTGKLTVLLDSAPRTAPAGRMVSVGGRTGWLNSAEGVTVLRFTDGAGRLLTIQVGAGIAVAEQDLLAFAAGVRPTSAARPGNG